MKTLNDFNFQDKKALIRVDFNVPLDENFKVTDATRIISAKSNCRTNQRVVGKSQSKERNV